MFSHLSTTLEGLFSIRLYHAEVRFDLFNQSLIDSDHKALYSLVCGKGEVEGRGLREKGCVQGSVRKKNPNPPQLFLPFSKISSGILSGCCRLLIHLFMCNIYHCL